MAHVEKYLIGATEEETKSLFKRTINILEKNNIRYWLMSGTLLACMRDHKFISWDNDIDLAVDTIDLYHLRKQFLEAEIEMLDFHEKGHSNTIILKDLRLNEYSAMHIDLFEIKNIRGHLYFRWAIRNNWFVKIIDMFVYLVSLDKYNKTGLFPPEFSKQIMKIFSIMPNKIHKNFYVLLENFRFILLRKRMIMFPESKPDLIKMNFYDMKVNIPVRWKDHLLLIFGKNWMIPDPTYHDKENKLIQRKIDGYEIVALNPETAYKIKPGDLT